MSSQIDNCPHCNANLNGDPIPENIRQNYSGTHWRREMGWEYPEKYDGVWEWECPDCKGRWPSQAQVIKNKLKGAKNVKTDSNI